jgi:hypothetical protein
MHTNTKKAMNMRNFVYTQTSFVGKLVASLHCALVLFVWYYHSAIKLKRVEQIRNAWNLWGRDHLGGLGLWIFKK